MSEPIAPSRASSSSTSDAPSRSTSSPLPPHPAPYLPPNLTASSFRPPSVHHATHPLLPPLGTPSSDQALRSLGAKIDLPSSSLPSSSASGSRRSAPEKCLTFCSQRDGDLPFCRMLCLRRRNRVESKEEALRKLRPPRAHPISTGAAIGEGSMSASGAGTSEEGGRWWDVHPFDSLRRKVEPYSLIYVRGTADGVVGRYMEELEFDDGVYEFGNLSRGIEEGVRRRKRETERIEYVDWGDGSSLLHVPLTSLLHPILSIPNTITTVTTPSANLVSQYRTSWSDGSQSRAWTKFSTEVTNGGAFTMLSKVRSHWAQKVKEREEELRKLREARRDAQASRSGEGVEGEKGQ